MVCEDSTGQETFLQNITLFSLATLEYEWIIQVPMGNANNSRLSVSSASIVMYIQLPRFATFRATPTFSPKCVLMRSHVSHVIK